MAHAHVILVSTPVPDSSSPDNSSLEDRSPDNISLLVFWGVYGASTRSERSPKFGFI